MAKPHEKKIDWQRIGRTYRLLNVIDDFTVKALLSRSIYLCQQREL
nr:hypothetical protein [Legionella nautarum]